MKFQIKSLVAVASNYLKKSIGILSVLLLVGQIAWWVAPSASAAPLVATSADSVSTQVSGKADELKGAAKQEAGKAQSQLEDKSAEAERKVKANAKDTKNVVDRNLDRAEEAGESLAQKVQNFFSK